MPRLFIATTYLVFLNTFALAQDKKAAVPDEASRKSTLKELKELFKSDYAEKSQKGRLALATKLLNEGWSVEAIAAGWKALLD